MLAPTRVLAMQHVRTLQERMPDVKYDLIHPTHYMTLFYLHIFYCYYIRIYTTPTYIYIRVALLRGGSGKADTANVKKDMASGDCQVRAN